MTFERWDILLIPFPFTDLSSQKRRPAVVLSPNEYNAGEDLILLFLTSKLDRQERPGDHQLSHWKEAGLPKPSMTRMKLMTLKKDHVIKKIGSIQRGDQTAIQNKLKDFFDL